MKKVSICIPAYKRADVLKRCLDSVFEQDFSDFEVIVTDDSPNDDLKNLIKSYQDNRILYFKNNPALGFPENWNEAIRKASGEYIKIMHHDDWFATPQSLRKFADMLDENPTADIAFSGSYDIYPSRKVVHITSDRMRTQIIKEPEVLFKGNWIGDPSVCIFRNHRNLFFDSKLIWRVDTDFYIFVLKQNPKIVYSKEILVHIGIDDFQITKKCISDPNILIKEAVYLYRKLNLNNKSYSYKKSLLRVVGREIGGGINLKVFNYKNGLLDGMELRAIDVFWAKYFFYKKQIRALLVKFISFLIRK